MVINQNFLKLSKKKEMEKLLQFFYFINVPMSKVFFEQSVYVRRNLRSWTTDQRSLLSTSCRLKQFPQKWKNIKANNMLVENQ